MIDVKPLRFQICGLLVTAGISITTYGDLAEARTAKEFAAIFTARDYYLKPSNLFEDGYNIGLITHCNKITFYEINVVKENYERWVRIATTDYEPINSPGVLNNDLFKKAMFIVEKGEKLGAKEGMRIKGERSFQTNFCSKILDTFDLPPGNLGK